MTSFKDGISGSDASPGARHEWGRCLLFFVIFCGMVVVITVWYSWTRILDTPSNRRRVSREVSTLVRQSKNTPEDLSIANELIRRSRSKYDFEAVAALVGLGDIGDAASSKIFDIAVLMHSENATIRREAARALANLGHRSAPVMGDLAFQVAKNPSDDESWFAAEALGRIGGKAERYLPLLRAKIGTGAPQFDDSLRRAIALIEMSVKLRSVPGANGTVSASDRKRKSTKKLAFAREDP